LRQRGAADQGHVSRLKDLREANRGWAQSRLPIDISDIDSGAAEIAVILREAGVPPTPLFEAEDVARPLPYSPNHRVITRLWRSSLDAGWMMFHGPYVVTVGGALVRNVIRAYSSPRQPKRVRRVFEANGTRSGGPGWLNVVSAEEWHRGLSLTYAMSATGPSVETLDELIDDRIASRMTLCTSGDEPEVGIRFYSIKEVLREGLSRALAAPPSSS
jgi:hypothetical protein